MTEFSVCIIDDDKPFADELNRQIKEWGVQNDCRIGIGCKRSAMDFVSDINELAKWSVILEGGPKTFYIQSHNLVTSVHFKDILYFEAQLHNIIVWTLADKFQFRKSISELKNELPSYFVQSSRSYIVNMKHVKSIRTHSVELDNGQHISLTKTYKADVMSKFMRK